MKNTASKIVKQPSQATKGMNFTDQLHNLAEGIGLTGVKTDEASGAEDKKGDIVENLYRYSVNELGMTGLGDLPDFWNGMKDERVRRNYFDVVSSRYNVGDYETFNRNLSRYYDALAKSEAVLQQAVMDAERQGYERQQKEQKMAVRENLGNTYGEVMSRYKARIEESTKEFDEKYGYLTPAQYRAFSGIAGEGSAYQNFRKTQINIPEDVRLLNVSKNILSDAQKIVDQADRNAAEGSSFIKNAGYGLRDSVFDVSTWDMGISDLGEADLIRKVVQKADKGEKLTEAEDMLLTSLGIQAATEIFFGSDLGRGYTVGSAVGRSLPFMLEFALNPLSGTGSSIAKTAISYAAKKFGTKGMQNLVRYGARVAGDVAGATGMSLTTGLPGVAADAMRRHTGDAKFDFDESGNVQYAGHTEGDSWGTAIGKSVGARTFENLSEMAGNYFPAIGKLIGKSKPAEWFKATRVGKWTDEMSASNVGRFITDLEQRAGWHGVFGEWAEEQLNTILNAVFIGDQKLSDLTDWDQQLDTFLGVAMMAGFFSAARTGAYVGARYSANKKYNQTNAEAERVIGEGWQGLKEEIDQSPLEQRTAILNELLEKSDLSLEQGMAVLEYARRRTTLEGVKRMRDKQVAEGEKSPVDAGLDEARLQGREAADGDGLAKHIAKVELDGAAARLTPQQRAEADAAQNVGDFLMAHPDQMEALEPYFHAKAKYEGLMEGVREGVEGQVRQAVQSAEQLIHSDGNVYSATLKADDAAVNILSGRVVMTPEGTLDREKSDKRFIVIHDQGRHMEMRPIEDIYEVSGVQAGEAFKEATANDVRQKAAEREAAQIDGVRDFAPGEQFTVLSDGMPVQMEVVAQNPDGTVTVTDGTTQSVMPREALQKAVNEAEVYAQVEALERRKGAGQEGDGKYGIDTEVMLNTPEGVVRGHIVSTPDADGLIQVMTDTPVNGNRVNVYTAEQLDGMVVPEGMETVSGNRNARLGVETNVTAAQEEGLQPIGENRWGKVYKWTVGKAKEAAAFLRKLQGGYLKGVFHRNDLGSIDLAWGNEKGGLKHIIQKHIVENDDFDSVDEAMQVINDVIANGELTLQKGGAKIEKDGYRVVLAKDENNNWVVTAYDYSRMPEDKKRSENQSRVLSLSTMDTENGAAQGGSAQTGITLDDKGTQTRKESQVPVDENGNPVYEKADPDAAWDDIVAKAGGDQAVAQSVAESVLNDKQAALKKMEKAKPKGGTTVEEKIAGEKQRKEEIERARADVEAWKRIVETPKRREEAALAEETSREEKKEDKRYIDPRTMSDEEKQVRGERLRNAPAVEVETGQIVATKKLSARKAAEKWWDENVPEPVFYDTEVGEVEINRNSVESSLAHRYGQAKLDAITSLVEGFENAVYLGTMPDSRERGVIDNYFAYPINYNGKRSYVFCRAMQDANKNRLYVHEVFVADNIKEKGDTLQTAASKPHGGIALYKDILANVLVRDQSKNEKYSPSSSDGHLAEHSESVPDLLPTQGENTVSTDKDTAPEEESQEGNVEKQEETLTKEEAKEIVSRMEESAEVAPEMELTIENWDAEFGEDGVVNTPIGEVKMGENQFTKLMRQGREGKLGMVKPTLENPDVIIEDSSEAKEGDTTERGSSYVFVKAFVKSDGSRYYYFTSVTVSKDGREVVISNQEKRRNVLTNLLMKGKLVWKHADDVSTASDVADGLYSSQGKMSDPTTEGTVAPQTDPVSSTDKNTVPEEESQEGKKEKSEKQPHLLPKELKQAYESGEKNAITKAEKALRDYVKGSKDLKLIASTYLQSKDRIRGRKDKESPEYKVQAFIAKTCKDALMNSGIPVQAFQAARVRRDLATTTENPDVLDVLSVDLDYEVLLAVIHNPKTRVATLRGFTERFSNNSLEYEAQQAIAQREENNRRTFVAPERNEGENLLDYAERVDKAKQEYDKQGEGEDKKTEIQQAEEETDINPTEAQKKAGNYKKGHVKIDGLDITIEQPKGSVRRGVDANGTAWETKMNNTYGYIRGTQSVDGDHIDVFLSDNPTEGNVYVVDQINQDTGEFDEHKVMYGFNSMEEATDAYLSNYSKGWKMGPITEVNKEEFKKWIDSSHRKTKPFAEYKDIKENDILFREVDDYTAEEQAIIDEAKKNGTYMKAPNGNPTNLTGKQWVQVRTGAFKKWFGDWEKAERMRMIDGIKPTVVSGAATDKAQSKKEYANIGEATNKADGRTVRFFNSAFDKIYREGGLFAKSVTGLKECFENSMLAYSERDNKGGTLRADGTAHKAHPNVAMFHNYVGKVVIDGKECFVRFTVQEENTGTSGTHFFFVSDVGVYEKMQDNQTGLPLTRQRNDEPASVVDAKLRKFLEEARAASDNSSKIVDENGEPMVFYHNTNAEFTTFDSALNGSHTDAGWLGDGFYFYGDEMEGNGYGKNKIAVFLNVKNIYYATSEENNRLAELNDRDVSIEFREDVESEGYDGVYYNGDLRQEAVVFYPNQIKSATDNTGAFSTEDDDIRYREAEDAGDKSLVAVHNLSAEHLVQALELGGFPMPSIAITKVDVGHTNFGDISLVFDKESINPTDRRNKVYGEDAWTPTFPQVGYKLNDEKTSDIYRRANKAGSLPLFNPVYFHPDNYERQVTGLGSKSLVNHFKDDYGAKQLYLSETGNAVEEYEQHEVEKYLPDQVALYEKILKEIGLEKLKSERDDTLENDVKRLIGEHYNIDFGTIKPFRIKVRIDNTIQRAIDYAENGNRKTESDIDATKKKIDERVDPKKFEAWLEDLFAGVVEKKGIRNDNDPFTPSGNSRKWESLYDKITLENVVKNMQKQVSRGGQGLFGGSIFGSAQEEYKSVDEIRKAAQERIRTMNEADYQAQRNAITDRLSAIKIPGVGNGFSDTMDMVQNIQDAVARSHTPKGIHKYLKEFYPRVTMETANEIADIVKDIQRMSARYFEAKPYRAVGFDEVRLAVVPSDTDANLVAELERRGIQVRRYGKGNETERRQIVKEATEELNLRFREGHAQRVNERFNEQLQRQIDGTLPKGHVYELGMPSEALLSAGIPDLPIEMAASQLAYKSSSGKHDFDLSEVMDLPNAIANSIAVFEYGDKSKAQNILTILKHNGDHFLVGMFIRPTVKGRVLEVNSIRNVFPKNGLNIVRWVADGKLTYANKEELLNFLDQQRTNYADVAFVLPDEQVKQEKTEVPNSVLKSKSKQRSNSADVRKLFSHAAKIVEEFENPSVFVERNREGEENIPEPQVIPQNANAVYRGEARQMAEELHAPVEFVTRESLPQGHRGAKGYYNPRTGKIAIVVENHTSVEDVRRTVFHEAVAHYGLRGLFGGRFNEFLDKAYAGASKTVREKIVEMSKKHGWNVRTATEEYLAELAERGFEQREEKTFWDKVKDLFRGMFREMKRVLGFRLTDNDLRYVLWKSYQKLRGDGGILSRAEDVVMRGRFGIAQSERERIVSQARQKGTYRKAPNGKQSRLTGEQWVTVRTEAFKRWFGDWEKAIRIEKLRKSKPIVVSGEDYKGKYELNSRSAGDYIIGSMRGEYINKDTGDVIKITRSSQKVAHHDAERMVHLKSIAYIPRMIENAIFIAEEPNTKTNTGFDSYRYYVVGMKMGGVDYTIKLVVGVKDGESYYDHALTEIEKNNLLDLTDGVKADVSDKEEMISGIKDKRLISILQTDASKIVDENGEPRVLYLLEGNTPLSGGMIPLRREAAKGTNAVFLNVRRPAVNPKYEDTQIDKLTVAGHDGIIREKDGEVEEIMVFYPQQVRDVQQAGENEAIPYREVEGSIEQTNSRFNELLEELTEENADELVLDLGTPSPILRAAGVEDKPMKLYGNKVIKKMKKHGFALDELRDLPRAVADPIAVFNNLGRIGNRSILTELKTKDGNFLVSIDLGKTKDVDFNIVSSIFGKTDNKIVNWINKGYATYVNKEKTLGYLYYPAPIAETPKSQELSTATKIVKDFENPRIEDENSRILYREDTPPVGGSAREEYERRAGKHYRDNLATRVLGNREAWQDYALGLKDLQQAVEKASGPIKDYEDAYTAENQRTSIDKAEKEFYRRNYFDPLMKAVASLVDKGKTYEEITRYMMAKHGLERNRVFALRDAREQVKAEREALEKSLKNGEITQEKYEKEQRKLDRKEKEYYQENRKRDYSGLTALTEEEIAAREGMEMNIPNMEAVALEMVEKFEQGNEQEVEELWKRVNAATKKTLKTSMESGVISKGVYDEIRSMFAYYVPLRGWNDRTAGDVYEYLRSRQPSGGATVRRAAGRESQAEDPIATIGMMADRAISEGNKNKVKQRFLNLALNRPSDLFTVRNVWYVKDEGANVWERSLPDIPAEATPEEVARIVEEHEALMKRLAEKGLARKSKNGLNIRYRHTDSQEQEHAVVVRQGGKEYVVYVNGNPRAAQALNGLTLNQWGDVTKGVRAVTRFMSANMTSRNPTFVMRNLMRDVLFSATAVYIKEDGKYTGRYYRNLVTVMPAIMRGVSGKENLDKAVDRYFKEFLENGGETGYTAYNTLEDYRKEIKRKIRNAKVKNGVESLTIGGARAVEGLVYGIEWMNRVAEDMSRFAVFMTSRQSGRSIQRSISDAKEVTVNFNRKGGGRGFLPSVFQTSYMFFNVSVQSAQNLWNLAKANPWKAAKAFGFHVAMGYLQGLLNDMLLSGDDDPDKYANLPDYIRQNSLCIYLGDDYFLTISLSPEQRPAYSLGESIYQATLGRGRERGFKGVLRGAVGSFAELLPINPLQGTSEDRWWNWDVWVPDMVAPVYEVAVNRNFFGSPIYKDNSFNKYDPQYTKAYAGTSKWLVRSSELLNEATGGDRYRRGWLDLNPAAFDHLLDQYFGGVLKTAKQTINSMQAIFDPQMRQARNYPVVSGFMYQSGERDADRLLNEAYYRLKREAQETERILSGYRKETHKGSLEYAEKLDSLYRSPQVMRMEYFKGYEGAIDQAEEILKQLDGEDKEQVKSLLRMMKDELLQRTDDVDRRYEQERRKAVNE